MKIFTFSATFSLDVFHTSSSDLKVPIPTVHLILVLFCFSCPCLIIDEKEKILNLHKKKAFTKMNPLSEQCKTD